MSSHTFLVMPNGSPYDDHGLFPPSTQDGPLNFSGALIVSDMVVGNQTKALGTLEFAADQSIGKVHPTNPIYTTPGAFNKATFYGNGFGWTQDAAYRNRARAIRDELQNQTTDVRLTSQYHTRTPIALSNVIPADYFTN